jgi:hypothetical protein
VSLLHDGNNDDTGNDSDDDCAGFHIPLAHPRDYNFESKTNDTSDEGEYDILHGSYG